MLISFFRGILGTRSIFVAIEGLSKFKVGGHTLSRIARIENMASTAPAAPSKWPVEDLVDDIDRRQLAIHNAFYRTQLDFIANRRGVAMGIDVINLGCRMPPS